MASAGQAQAHSSQPMHFSSPSGQRLSWWRPWKRGAVGSFSNGYCSVTTFLNIVRKVTPKPATGSQRLSLMPLESFSGFWGVSLVALLRCSGDGGAVRGEGQRRGAAAHGTTRRHGRDGEPAGERVVRLLARLDDLVVAALALADEQ